RLWSPEQIVDALPELIGTVEARIDEFPPEHREKNQVAVESLKADPPSPAQVRDGSRSRDLGTLGFALDALGRRTDLAGDPDESLHLFQAAHELFRRSNPLVRANIEAVLALEIPTRLERVRRQWEEIGEHIAPAAVRRAQRTVRRPEDLSALLPPSVWTELQQAVERGDAEAVGQALVDVRDDLETNLRLRLDAKPEYREPVSELRVAGGPDPAVV